MSAPTKDIGADRMLDEPSYSRSGARPTAAIERETAVRFVRGSMDRVSVTIPPIMKLAPELLCHTARFLPYRDAWTVVNVSKMWRATLLAEPFLWTHVAVHLTEDTFHLWVPTLRALVARSAHRPLTLELDCDVENNDYGPLFAALEGVAAFLADHMEFIKSLSLRIPTCKTSRWYRLLRKRAPLLEVLRIHNSTDMDDTPRLPSQLFAGYAPRLRSLVLQQAYFPYDLDAISGAALSGVTSLCFHVSDFIKEGMLVEHLAHVMPRLQQLTCTVLQGYRVVSYCPLALHLRVNVAPGVGALVAGFPRAKSVQYSFAGGIGREALDVVEAAILSLEHPVTAVEIAWAPLRASIYWLGEYEERYLSLEVNGHPLVVDVTLEMLRTVMTPNAVAHLARSVQTLSVVGEMWDVFSRVEMPSLRDLAIHMHAGEEPSIDRLFNGKPAGGQHNLEALRIIRASDGGDMVVPATVIANLVRSIVVAGSTPTLYLSGITVAAEGCSALNDLVARIAYDFNRDEAAVENWSWEFAQEKIVAPGRIGRNHT